MQRTPDSLILSALSVINRRPAMSDHADCPFCTLPAGQLCDRTEAFVIIHDRSPVSPGHTLIIPQRHVESLFALTPAEFADLQEALQRARDDIDRHFQPEAYNIGINDGSAAGQTVAHLHVHLIPRYPGDQPDPRGGVRWIFPERARYWPE